VDGRRYLDAISGAFCVQLGYGRSDLARALSEAASLLPFARPAAFESEASEDYARELLDAVGSPYTRALFTSSGSEAVDVALKAAYRYQRAQGRPGRTKFARFRGHFHGATLAALRVTDLLSRRAPYEPLLEGGTPALESRGSVALEQDLGDAMKAADVKWASQFHANDWATVGSGGKVFTKDMFLQDLKSGSIKLDDFKLGPMNVQVFGNTATVQGCATEKRSRNGKDVSGQVVWLDVFEKRAGKWVIVASTGGRVK
jgi:adenosylmethionine-8-amino-7-oxononanoate aminotransferase